MATVRERVNHQQVSFSYCCVLLIYLECSELMLWIRSNTTTAVFQLVWQRKISAVSAHLDSLLSYLPNSPGWPGPLCRQCDRPTVLFPLLIIEKMDLSARWAEGPCASSVHLWNKAAQVAFQAEWPQSDQSLQYPSLIPFGFYSICIAFMWCEKPLEDSPAPSQTYVWLSPSATVTAPLWQHI